MGDTPARARQELALQLALGPALFATKGPATPEVKRAYRRADTLCQHVEDASQRGAVLLGLRMSSLARGDIPTAHALGEHLLRLAQQVEAPALLLYSQRRAMRLFKSLLVKWGTNPTTLSRRLGDAQAGIPLRND